MRNLKYIGLSLAALMSLGFTGCSGGGGSSSSSTVSGQFIDAPVEGLSYECSSGQSGVTNSNGTFTCNRDDNVTFKIGNLILGSSSVQSVITPFHLYTEITNTEKAYNVSQLLHSLDDDNNPDNNIKIDTALLSNISLNGISMNADSNTFQNELASALASAGKTAYNREQAKAKMFSYMSENSYTSNLSVNVANELQALETQMCSAPQKLIKGECSIYSETTTNGSNGSNNNATTNSSTGSGSISGSTSSGTSGSNSSTAGSIVGTWTATVSPISGTTINYTETYNSNGTLSESWVSTTSGSGITLTSNCNGSGHYSQNGNLLTVIDRYSTCSSTSSNPEISIPSSTGEQIGTSLTINAGGQTTIKSVQNAFEITNSSATSFTIVGEIGEMIWTKQ